MQDKNYIFFSEPYGHQREAFDASADAQNFALLLDMGTGKTKVTLDTVAYLFEKSAIEFVLVVAPKGVISNWRGEIEAHLPPRIGREVVLWNPSLSKQRRKELNDLHTKSKNLKFLLMNVEAFSTKKGVDVAEVFVNRFKTFMVVDESTTIKNRKAKRTKSLCAVGRGAVYRRILTGSPVTRSPLDLFSQMAFLDPAILGFNSFYALRGATAWFKDEPWERIALIRWWGSGGWMN